MQLRFVARALAAALVCASAARAQQVIDLNELGYADFQEGGGVEFVEGDEPPETADESAAKKPKKPGPRTQKLRQLSFDRRPSAILAAWAKVRETEVEPSEDDGEVKTSALEAAPEPGMFGGTVVVSSGTSGAIVVTGATAAIPLTLVPPSGGAVTSASVTITPATCRAWPRRWGARTPPCPKATAARTVFWRRSTTRNSKRSPPKF